MFHPGSLLSVLTVKLVNINAWFAPVSLFKVSRKTRGLGVVIVDLTGRFGGVANHLMLVKKINHTTTPSLGVVGGSSARIVCRSSGVGVGGTSPKIDVRIPGQLTTQSSPLLATR